MSFAVIIHEKGGQPRRQEFNKNEVTIGRVQGNDIILPKQNVSKRHSRIVVKDGKFIIVDLKSTNGTYVNGRKIASPMVIKETDKIYIGDFILSAEPLEGPSDVPVPGPDAGRAKAPPPPPRPKNPQPIAPRQSAPAKPRPVPGPAPVPAPPAKPARAAPPPAEAPAPAPVAAPAPAPAPAPAVAAAAPAAPAPVAAAPVDLSISGASVHNDLHRWLDHYLAINGIAAPSTYTPGQNPNQGVWDQLNAAAQNALGNVDLSGLNANDVVSSVLSETLSVGPLADLLGDASVTQIVFNGAAKGFVKRGDKTESAGAAFSGNAGLIKCASRLLAGGGTTVTANTRFADGYLGDGSRVHLAMPSVGGPFLTIDRPSADAADLDGMVNDNILTAAESTFLRAAMTHGRVVVVSSNDLDARFDMISALTRALGEDVRVVSIASGGRLGQLGDQHVALSSADGIEPAGLIEESLKMRPERLVVADARGRAVLRALTAMGGSVKGGILGIDAESPEDAFFRMSRQAGLGTRAGTQEIEAMIRDRADVLVQVLVDATGRRFVDRILDLDGEVQDVFQQSSGMGFVPRWFDNAIRVGHDLDSSIFG